MTRAFCGGRVEGIGQYAWAEAKHDLGGRVWQQWPAAVC